MNLTLDERQRAMLREMRVPVWLPPPAALVAPAAAAPVPSQPLPARQPQRPAEPSALAGAIPAEVPAAPLPAPVSAGTADSLAVLAATVHACQACGLCAGRKAAVFAPLEEARQCDWLVVADPPTDEDVRAGAPVAGEAGALLDAMLRAVGCRRDGIASQGAWLSHVVKCRPAAVRNPEASELAACLVHLRQEVALVRPRVILAMGRFPALALLTESIPDVAQVPLGRLRGATHRFGDVPVVVTHAPARLLRAPADKAGAWADLVRALGIARQPAASAASDRPTGSEPQA